MTLFNKTWIAMLMLSAVLVIPMRTQASSPSVIISEIGWAGSETSSSDEWIELTNVTQSTIDVSGWSLTGAGDITIPDETVIEPHSTYLISNYDQTHENSTLGVTSNLVTASLSLSNSGFTVYLNNNDGTQIDSAGDGSTPFAGRSGGSQDSLDGRYGSMVRVDGSLNGSLETSWMDAVDSIGFKTDSTELGTPGLAESWLLLDQVADVEEGFSLPEGSILINEFVSNPNENEVEWIEILSTSDVPVDLTGWTVEDATERQTLLGEDQLEPGAYFVIQSPIGQLNNDGDSIILKDANGVVIDELEYGNDEIPDPDKGQSTALTPGGFQVTDTPTPGDENIIEIIEVEEEEQIEEEIIEEEVEEEVVVEEEIIDEEPIEETVEDEVVDEVEEVPAAPSTAITEITSYTGPLTLFFHTLYPNTPGTDAEEEYITLVNTGNESIDLEGWVVADEAGNDYTFSQVSLAAQSTFVLMRTESSITLNNNGDTLYIHSPDNDLIDTVTYEKATSGDRYVNTDGTWAWESSQTEVVEQTKEKDTSLQEQSSSPAPAPAATTATTPVPTTKTVSTTYSSTNTSYSTAQTTQSTNTEEAKALSDGSKVTLTGVVTAIPGTLGKQIMYIQDETGGIQVYKYDSLFPELEIGNVISFTGELSTSRGERRVKLATDTQIDITQTPTTNPQSLDLDELSDEYVGQLVRISGLLQTKASNRLTLESEGNEAIVYLGSGSYTTDLFERGAKLQVSGILTNTSGELRVRPRSTDDILVLDQKNETVITTVLSGKETSESDQSKTGWILVLITAGVLGLLALRKYFPQGRTRAHA